MYYIPLAFNSMGKFPQKVGSALAKIYAVCCIFAMIGGWNLFQINAMTAQFTEVTGGDKSIFANNGWDFRNYCCYNNLVYYNRRD